MTRLYRLRYTGIIIHSSKGGLPMLSARALAIAPSATLEITNKVLRLRRSGVDIISMGAITHSVKAFDISMKIRR